MSEAEKPSPLVDWAREVVSDEAEKFTEPAIEVAPDTRRCCYPVHQLLVNKETRLVRCKTCNLEFTAFDALLYITREWVRYSQNASCLKSDVKRLEEQRASLRKQVQSLKGMLERAKRSKVRHDLATNAPVKPTRG
jgi:hypothetical protein